MSNFEVDLVARKKTFPALSSLYKNISFPVNVRLEGFG